MKHQLFIASYRKDFEWLGYCLASIHRFAVGFETTVCVPLIDFEEALEVGMKFGGEMTVIVRDGEGFMRAQIAMMEADLLCPAADVIYLVGSDCIFTRPFTPEEYCPHGRAGVLMNSYEKLASFGSQALPWRRGTERVLGFPPDYEYMRRLPSVFPASIFAPMRRHVETLHGMPFGDYIIEGNKARRDTSEANILGAFAHRFMPETCEFVNCDDVQWEAGNPIGWPSALAQHWSHGGLDLPCDACYEYTIDGVTRKATGQTPRSLINQILYGERPPT